MHIFRMHLLLLTLHTIDTLCLFYSNFNNNEVIFIFRKRMFKDKKLISISQKFKQSKYKYQSYLKSTTIDAFEQKICLLLIETNIPSTAK